MSEIFVPPNPPMSFAIMRNAHESIRNAITELSTLRADDGNRDRFKELWNDFIRAISVHMDMENIDVFPLLNKYSESFNDERLTEEHTSDEELIHTITMQLNESDELISEDTFNAWKMHHLAHLEHEEKVMMPLTMKTGASHDERSTVVSKLVVTPALLRNEVEFVWYIGWCIRMLSKTGSAQNAAGVAVRVFCHGLQAASTAPQWSILQETIKANTTSEIWEDMVANYHIDSDGMQPE